MGLLDNSGDILIDAVLTDVGREFLARNDGSFEVVRFSLGDDEVDYSLFDPNAGSLQQDTNVLNTPVFEANVNEKIALKSQLLSISNPDLRYLPTLSANVSAISLGERNDSQIGKSIEFTQGTQSGRTVPSEIVDGSFLIQVDNDLLFVEKQTPVNITPFGSAQYVVPRTAIGANQGAIVSFNIAVQALSNEVWDVRGTGAVGSRTITTKVKCLGALSGLSAEITITLNEEFSR
jgi:hypothetical protein